MFCVTCICSLTRVGVLCYMYVFVVTCRCSVLLVNVRCHVKVFVAMCRFSELHVSVRCKCWCPLSLVCVLCYTYVFLVTLRCSNEDRTGPLTSTATGPTTRKDSASWAANFGLVGERKNADHLFKTADTTHIINSNRFPGRFVYAGTSGKNVYCIVYK